MQILHLIDIARSTIKYKVINFNDGEPHIVLEEVNRKEEVAVVCRVANPSDLYILMQVGDILNRQGVEWNLSISYLMSMRMDRVISYNESFTLNVVADIISNMNPTSIHILEAHSDRTMKLLDAKEYPNPLYEVVDLNNKIIVLPDEGAYKRYTKLGTSPIVTCTKVRDSSTGKLSGFKVLNPEVITHHYPNHPIMVIDDLCDGGGTFVGIAQEIRKYAPDRKLSIYVTHMVNPNGIIILSNNYDKVTFTNSYKDWEGLELPNNVKVIKVI